jgi:glycosyltransferase involved in cell wall biosynthesis
MIFTSHGGVPITIFNSASTRGAWLNREEFAAFMTACEIFLRKNRPDVVWTYGGDDTAIAVQRLVKHFGIPILFALHNFGYHDRAPFTLVDRIMVPAECCRRHYRETLGIECHRLPLVVDPERVLVSQREPRYATFVNPTPTKGIYIYQRIAEILSRLRPDIELLLVEGSARRRYVPEFGADLSQIGNLRVQANSPDAKNFLSVTKLLLMPSLLDNAGIVAMEAMLNGIPVIASTRGGLPETIGNAGALIDIPARYSPDTRELPTAEEVQPWVDTIIRLWDDQAEYDRRSQAALARSQAWLTETLAGSYIDFFTNLVPHKGPLAPPSKDAANAAVDFAMASFAGHSTSRRDNKWGSS